MGLRKFPVRQIAALLVRQDDDQTWIPDAVTSISFAPSWTVTDHPVETGAAVSDHVQKQPETITLTCIITENPVKIGGVIGGRIRLRALTQFLRDTADARQFVDIVTRRLGVFRNYVITRAPHVIDKVARLQFDLELREIRLATAGTVLISVDDVDTEGDVWAGVPDELDVGEQGTTSTESDPEAEEVDQSALAALVDAI